MMMGDDSNPTTTENVEYDHSYQLYPHSWLETFQLYLPHRILAAVSSSSSPYKIDYNVLSVAAMTLALIMMVEYVRHRLDHWAHVAATTDTPQQSKQPIFRAVLEGVYAECKCIWSACSFFLDISHPCMDRHSRYTHAIPLFVPFASFSGGQWQLWVWWNLCCT